MSVALEVLQWAAILFLGVMALGLTRQLGFFLVPRTEQLRQQGPDVGSDLSPLLGPVAGEVRERLAAPMAEAAAVLVVDERCEGCRQILDQFEQGLWDTKGRLVLVAVVKESGRDFVSRVRAIADVVAEDPDGTNTRGAGIVATPYGLVVDEHLRVQDREVGGHVEDLLANFLGRAGTKAAAPSSVVQPVRHSTKEAQHV